MSVKVEVKTLDDLTPDPNNVNKHTQKGHALVENSLRRRGAFRSVAAAGKGVDKPVVMAGNLTIEKARDAGFEEVIFVHTNGRQLVSVIRDDIEPGSPEAIALGIEDNESGKQSYSPDIDVLAALAAGDNAILSALRAEDKTFDRMIEGMGLKEETHDAPADVDRAVELLEKWGVQTGDLWQIGEHRLICGDCTDAATVARVMDGEKADTVLTSPPYNQGNSSGDLFSHGKRVENLYPHSEDDMTDEEYIDFIFNVLNTCAEIVNDVHSVVWNVAYNAKSRNLYGKIIFSDRNPFQVFESIVWNKGGAINLPQVGIYSRWCEFVYVMAKGEKYLTSQEYGNPRWNYWETKKRNQLREHHATFPLEFAERGMSELSLSQSIVFEPFCGSGTVLVACENLGRIGRGVELSPAYVAVALERMATAFPHLEIKKQ